MNILYIVFKIGEYMKQKLNYRNVEECLHATYKDMEYMTLDDAVFILSESMRKYHEAKNDRERTNLPRARIIKAYEIMLNIVKQPDMKEKVKEYIGELDAEYDRCMDWIEEHMDGEACQVIAMEMRAKTLDEVKNDLQGRLEELV